MKVSIYDLRDLNGRNAALHVVLGPWPERVCKQRGFSEARRLLTRDATQIEREEAARSTRLLSWSYQTPAPLLEDEETLGVDPALIKSLIHRAHANHPQHDKESA